LAKTGSEVIIKAFTKFNDFARSIHKYETGIMVTATLVEIEASIPY
jgi:hypothetical protein